MFLLGQQLEISGVVLEGKLLDQQQALQLWRQWSWEPACEGQPWPVVADQAGMQGQAIPAPETAAPEW